MTTDNWWRSAVLYQIYPRSFRDSGKDGVGDLRGIVEKLPYLAKLGVDGVWLSPFFQSPMADFGYDVSDYRNVDPLFGTLTDFDTLLTEAHGHGLKVIIDQVYSHTSDMHSWFLESREDPHGPKSDWYVWADPKADGSPPNNWLSVFGGPAWTWDPRRRQYYLHNFLAQQPDLNFHHPDVQEAILDVARFWLERGVDGFRLDVANYYVHDRLLRDNPPTGTTGHARPGQYQQHLYERSRPETLDFIERFRALLDTYPGTMAVAEIDSTDPVARCLEYTTGASRLHTAYSFALLRAPELTPHLVKDALSPFSTAEAWPSWSISNHDVKRALTRWHSGGDPDALARQLMALLLSLRGTIFLYQGDELGLPQATLRYEDLHDPESRRFWPADLGRDGARTPIPWQADAPDAGFTSGGAPWMAIDDAHRRLAVDKQEDDPRSVLSSTRRLLALRARSEAMRTGTIEFLEAPHPILLFERAAGDERLVFVFNLSADRMTLGRGLLPPLGEVVEGCQSLMLSPERLVLPPHGVLIAERG